MFVDLEASGLGPDSWPIELGVAWIDEEDEIRSESRLIRPEASWTSHGWSTESAAVHGIGRAELATAPSAATVARWFLRLAGGNRLVSDAPEIDERWLSRILDLGQHGIRLLDFDQLAWKVFGGGQGALGKMYGYRAGQKTVHRAEADARDLTAAWRAGLRRARSY